MKHYHDTVVIRRITLMAAIVAFLTLLATPLMAQRDSTRPLTPAERMEMRRARQNTMIGQEMQLRGLVSDKDWEQPDRQPQLRAIVMQAKQDFERIQVVNDEIMRAVTANTGFNYKNLAEQTSEIKKRAKRFKDNINLPPPDEAQATQQKRLDQISREEMRAALLMLNEQVMNFVTNPLFQTPNLMDVKLGAKASRDLDTLIELSSTIRKNAERLSKPQQQK